SACPLSGVPPSNDRSAVSTPPHASIRSAASSSAWRERSRRAIEGRAASRAAWACRCILSFYPSLGAEFEVEDSNTENTEREPGLLYRRQSLSRQVQKTSSSFPSVLCALCV